MATKYDLPLALAIALNTERVKFLSTMTDADLQKQDTRAVLRDLINDRAALRPLVRNILDQVEQSEKQLAATRLKVETLLNTLDGVTD